MTSTRKRARRALATRRRRHRGGKKLTPFELLRAFNEARASVDSISQEIYELAKSKNAKQVNDKTANDTMKGINDKKLKLFEEIKGFYYDNIPNMKHNDWTQLILKTPLQPESQNTPNEDQNNSYEDVIDDRFSDVVTVLTFWLEMRKQRVNNESSGFRRFFNSNTRTKKLDSSIKDIRTFVDWSLNYIDEEMYGPATKKWNSKLEARAFGRKHEHRNKMKPGSKRLIWYIDTLYPLVNTLRYVLHSDASSIMAGSEEERIFKRYQDMKTRMNDYEESG